jgi:hypothetical protein
MCARVCVCASVYVYARTHVCVRLCVCVCADNERYCKSAPPVQGAHILVARAMFSELHHPRLIHAIITLVVGNLPH